MRKSTTLTNKLGMSVLIALLGFGLTLNAQKKEKRVVKIIEHSEHEHGDADTVISKNVMVYHIDEDDVNVNIDSIIEAHKGDMDKHMKVMAFKLDSIDELDFDFKFDGEMEEMHIELERLMKEKGHAFDELKKIQMSKAGNMVFISEDGEHHTINIDEEVDGGVKHVKIITKSHCEEGNQKGERVESYIIKTGDRSEANVWHSKANIHRANVKIESIPMEDIAFLKKAGVPTKNLMNEAIKVEELKLKIEKIIENEINQTIVHIECLLPDEGPYKLEVLKKDSEALIKKETINDKKLKKEFEVKEEEAPYYLILSKNNQLFGRKIVL